MRLPTYQALIVYFLCLFSYVSPRKRNKLHRTHENEILEKTPAIVLKLPNVQFSEERKIGPHVVRRKTIQVETLEESCQNKTFKNEFNLLRRKVKCEPRDTVVEIDSPFEDIVPNAVIVKRCGGACSDGKKCIAVEKRNVRFYVRSVKENQMYCNSILVSEDVKCKCGCQQKVGDCNKKQTYSKKMCSCVCNNTDEYIQCLKNEGMSWDDETCSCICPERKPCTTGTYWKESQCRCVKRLGL